MELDDFHCFFQHKTFYNSTKNAVLLQQDEMKSKEKEKTNVLVCTSCSLTADKTHPNKLLISPTLLKAKCLNGNANEDQACIISHPIHHCHRMVPDGYRRGKQEEVCILSCILNITCHYKSWNNCSKYFFIFIWRSRWKRRKPNQFIGHFNGHRIKECKSDPGVWKHEVRREIRPIFLWCSTAKCPTLHFLKWKSLDSESREKHFSHCE